MAAIQKQVRLQADEVKASSFMTRLSMQKINNYPDAVKFSWKHSYLPKRPQNVDLHQNIRAALADTYYLMAESAFAEGKLDDARKHVAQTLGIDSGHQRAMALNAKIQRQEDRAKQVVERPASLGLQDDFLRKEERIEDAMQLGRQCGHGSMTRQDRI